MAQQEPVLINSEKTTGTFINVGNLYLMATLPSGRYGNPRIFIGYKDNDDPTWIRPVAVLEYSELTCAIEELGMLLATINNLNSNCP